VKGEIARQYKTNRIALLPAARFFGKGKPVSKDNQSIAVKNDPGSWLKCGFCRIIFYFFPKIFFHNFFQKRT